MSAQAPGLTVDPASLRGKSLFVGTPMYDGRCLAQYTFPLCQLSSLCTQFGIQLETYFLSGDAFVTKARDMIADRFMQSGATHLMFIDADIGFSPMDVIALLALQDSDGGRNGFDVLAAPYPLKRIAWDKVARAASAGMAKDDPAVLGHVAGDILLSPLHPTPFSISDPLEVSQAATGFMMIRRQTFEAYREAFPHRRYQPGRTGAAGESSPVVSQFFDTEIDGGDESILDELVRLLNERGDACAQDIRRFIEDRRATAGEFVSEDYMFCRRVRQIGMQVWACPWMVLTHTGDHTFTARLSELARIGG